MINLSKWRSLDGYRSMCFAAQGRLQGRAAKLLLVHRKSEQNDDLGQICLAANVWRYCLLPCVAVVGVFALLVLCRIKRLLFYSRVGKNRDTKRESPAGAGAGLTADHLAVLFSQKVLAEQGGNDIYRPVSHRLYYSRIEAKALTIYWRNS